MAPPKGDNGLAHLSDDEIYRAFERAAYAASPEAALESCVAAFSTGDSTDKDMDVVFEIRKADARAAADVCQRIYARTHSGMLAETGLGLRRVIAVPERTIPKSISGELEREKTRALLRDGKLEIIYDFCPEAINKGLEMLANEKKKQQRKKACVVGAGMSGLVSAKTLLESGLDVTIFEKRQTLGGLWSPGACYYSVTTQVGDGGYEFLEMTNEGDLISRAQIQDYQFKYAETFGVLPCCTFGVEVTSVQHDGHEWNVSTMSSNGQQTYKFEFMIVSTGIYSNPKVPHWSDLPGRAEYTGEIVHSTDLQSEEQLSGKSVLIIGGGKSSIDCTCTAAQAGAAKTHHVWRNNLTMGYHPDVCGLINGARILGEIIPFPDNDVPKRHVDYVQNLLENMYPSWGYPDCMIPPPHLFASCNVAITRQEYLDLFKAGAFTTEKASVVAFKGPNRVVLSTGTEVEADTIVCATGYKLECAFLDGDMKRQIGLGTPSADGSTTIKLYRGVLPPKEHKNMAFVGYIQGLFNLQLYEIQAHWATALFLGEFDLPSPKQRAKSVEQVLGFMRRFNPGSDGTCVASWQFLYMKHLLDDIGVPFDVAAAMTHDTVTSFRANVTKQLGSLYYVRSAAARARAYKAIQPTITFTLPTLPQQISKAGSESNLPAYLRQVKHVCDTRGEEVFATWYDSNGEQEGKAATFRSVWQEACSLSLHMKLEWGLRKGDRVVVLLMPGLHILSVTLGCFLAGVIPAISYPPDPRSPRKSMDSLLRVVQSCQPSLCLVDSVVKRVLSMSLFHLGLDTPDMPRFEVTDSKKVLSSWHKKYKFLPLDPPQLSETDVCFIQYTSGSTSNPRGVMITFKALETNVQLSCNMLEENFTLHDGNIPPKILKFFSWLPQYHDMGLMQFFMPLYKGWHQEFMSPMSFMANPLMWLKLMSIKGTQGSIAPDFAYNLCSARFQHGISRGTNPQLNLKHLVLAGTGAENIRVPTLKRFIMTFSPLGFRTNAFVPLYGLAEHVVCLCSMPDIHVSHANPALVAVGNRERILVSGVSVKIVDIESFQELPDGQEGEIWVSSQSKAGGYYGQEVETEEMFNAELSPEESITYLRTGDLGYFESGELFISGRLKDMIIVAGRNVYPVEIEDVVVNADRTAVRPGCVAVFALDDGESDEKLCIVFEIRKRFESKVEDIISVVWQAVGRETTVSPYHVIAIKQNTIPKTSSGKIRRRVVQRMLKMGHLTVVRERKADPDSRDAASDSRSGAIIEWKGSRDERQEQIFQLICTEVFSLIPQAGAEKLKENLDSTSVLEIGLDSILLERLQKRITDKVGLATPLSTGILLDDKSFRCLAIKVEEIRFPYNKDEEEDKAVGDVVGIKHANLAHARKEEEKKLRRKLQEAMPVETMPSRYDYCSQLPLYTEKEVPKFLVVGFNFMMFALCVVMTVPSLCVAAIPASWALNTQNSYAAVFAVLPVCYAVYLSMATLWLWFMRVILVAGIQEGRYPVYGPTHLRCWALGACIANFQSVFSPFAGTFVYAWLYRALGARVGEHAVIKASPVFSSFLLTVSHGASCTSVLPLQCHYFISSMLVLSPVFIGSNATVSHTANIEPGSKLMGGSTIDFCSTLPMGWTSSSNTYLSGAPSKPVKFLDQPLTRKRDILPVLMAPFMICIYVIAYYPHARFFNVFHSLLPNNALPTVFSGVLYHAAVLLCMLCSDFLGTLAFACMLIIVKWVLVQRITPGEQSFFKAKRMKMYEYLVEYTISVLYFLPHALQGVYLHLMGCKIADVIDYCDRQSAVHFSKLPLFAKQGELLEMGTGVFMSGEEISCRYEDPVTGQVFYHDATIGDYSYIGGNSVVGVGVEFKESSGVGGRSCVHSFTTVKESTISVGNSGQFIMRRPQTSSSSKPQVHSKNTPIFWKVMYMLKYIKISFNVSLPVAVFKTCVFCSFGMVQGYFNPSSVPEIVVCCYFACIVGLFMTIVIVIALCQTVYALPKKLLSGVESGPINSSNYNTWIHNSVMLVVLKYTIQPFIGSSPLHGILLRIVGNKVGKNFVADNTMVEWYECHNNAVGDNVTMNNHTILCPHTIQMDNSVQLLSVRVGDRVSLLPRSGVYGGTSLPDGVLLGSHCRPFRGQTITGHMEYNDTPCTAFTKVKAQDGLPGQEDGESLFNREPLTKPRAVEIVRETLASIMQGRPSLPNSMDSTGMEEIQLDSIELVEFAVQLKRKANVDVSIDAFFDLVTVSDVADALLAGELEQPKDEEPTDDVDFDIGLGFEFKSRETVYSGE